MAWTPDQHAQMRINLAAVGIHLDPDPANSRFDSQGTNMPTDAETAAMRYQITQMERQLAALQRPRSDQESAQIAAAHARADAMAAQFGGRASPPIPGETALQYRRRMLAQYQKYSPRMANAQLAGCNDAALGAVEDVVYVDAQTAARNAVGLEGKLIPHTFMENGRMVTEFTGDPMAWMSPMMTYGVIELPSASFQLAISEATAVYASIESASAG
jgi:hypothetical protein